jgi:hypothetical protein
MTAIEQYLEKYRIGFPTFEKLFNLKSDKLSVVLQKIVGQHECRVVFNDKPNFYKYIENDIPTKIIISAWSKIEITPTGIYYKSEYGQQSDVVLFNEFFTLDI